MSATYHIQWFGLLAERRGTLEETLSFEGGTPESIYHHFLENHALGLTTRHLRAAVNDEFVSWDHLLRDGDRIAFLPPMSGG